MSTGFVNTYYVVGKVQSNVTAVLLFGSKSYFISLQTAWPIVIWHQLFEIPEALDSNFCKFPI